ncbi:MAG: L,D-transpeptidase [Rhizobiales bacterium]|nr:L,D-transpeptidase [Hyphomicrobiales bacterium]MBO6697495.1 L,D-transpeptidase [Hyphomicrobiales bacterium]MBO6736250.1 L,D-transpeptidase [Hyphomicrobiales bacterium]MBO6912720.1 L,D-transpeptidase [Hyphomicrobiales bacterium]MBO6953889.1 L,D-transpeptidase [Hyphomicrobiales bacterium]
MIRRTGIGRWIEQALLAFCLLVMSAALAFAASLSVTIDLSDQEMVVRENARIAHTWSVSTARAGYCTPVGTYRPVRLERMWYSTIYDNAPMPHSIFFHGGYAIHGTTEIGNLGQPASHGCVRLHPDHARTLFDLVLEHGRSATQIIIRQ